MFEYFAKDEDATLKLAAALGEALDGQGVVLLEGQLGAGKTTFSRGLLRAMGHQGAVKSPTFTLVEPYEIGGKSVYHFDLYRLADPEELEFLGVDDYLSGNGLCLIEWADKGGDLLPPWDIKVQFTLDKLARTISLVANSDHGRQVINKLASH